METVQKSDLFKKRPGKTSWVSNTPIGEMLFTLDDGKTVYNLFRDYPWNMAPEDKEIFDKENPFWADFFIDRNTEDHLESSDEMPIKKQNPEEMMRETQEWLESLNKSQGGVEMSKGSMIRNLIEHGSDRKQTIATALRMLGFDASVAEDGGPGSGNWGHRGRPGKRGGSGKGGGKAYRGGSGGSEGYFSTKSDWTSGLSKSDKSYLQAILSPFGSPNEERTKKLFMMQGSLSDREWYVGKIAEVRNWKSDFAKRDLAEENLDKNDMRILRKIWNKFGLDDSEYKANMSTPEYKYWLNLKARAIGADVVKGEMPSSLKERLAEKGNTGNTANPETEPERADPEEVKRAYKKRLESVANIRADVRVEERDIRYALTKEYLNRKYQDVVNLSVGEIQKKMEDIFPTEEDCISAMKRRDEAYDEYLRLRVNINEHFDEASKLYKEFVELRDKVYEYHGLNNKKDSRERYERELKNAKFDTDEEKNAAIEKINAPLVKAESELRDYEERMKKNPQYLDKIYVSDLRNRFEGSDVEKRDPVKYDRPMTENDIISRISGGDRTSGSCASLAIAYVGCKMGFDVLDFRGGRSLTMFASKMSGVNGTLRNLPELKTNVESGPKDIENAYKLIKKMQPGKEYVLCTGRHCSVVRMTQDGKMQYLELQSIKNNGWTDFNGNPRYTLANRFGCWKTTEHGPSVLADVDSMVKHPEISKLLPYLNTAETDQKKGAGGFAK